MLRNVHALMREVPDWGPLVPLSLDDAPIEHQILVVRLLEAATGFRTMPTEFDLSALKLALQDKDV